MIAMILRFIKIKASMPKDITWIMFILIFPLFILQSACKKFVEVPPPAGIITENSVYTTNATATSVLTALYGAMNSSLIQGGGSISFFAGLSADEYTLNGGITIASYLSYYKNALSQIDPTKATGAEHWSPLYNFVFKCNAAIEGLNASSGLTPIVKAQLLGESKFLRAFFYFYLVNEFGDVPLALTADPIVNTFLSRSPREEVYKQIILDLQDAISLLSETYVDVTLLSSTVERTRPNKWAAIALLSRVYLYSNDYAKAEEQASAVISNTTLFDLLPNLNDVYIKNSREAIWQLQPTSLAFNTIDAQLLIIPPAGPSTGNSGANPIYLSKQLLQSFEAGDKRAEYGNWVDTTIYKLTATKNDTVSYPNKYKINLPNPTITATTNTLNMKEYFMVLRIGEQYLIRAEARAHQGKIGGAQVDLNAIRARAGLPNTAANDKSTLLSAILHERQVELFSEWGHRWFDLIRTEKIDEIMKIVTPLKANGGAWQSYKQLYPLPMIELQKAPNIWQNEGYN
ncbi:RagB/SusD family nutrient uptake outer membrane protein [Niastella caeni]|uniref:RagB/SusD family nutrient uptake outer membrane protein n=1 Tax=Niastella caeni TaxID=2569763 RepID=A0A4S8HXJ0_9BACT|nr:RagB/SusD family nutrient uptake outer membrane protein [Niastella caeni]THU39499.1 RagB/SusD family nutrient uptake outer membrane protein [Niastella caeni]